MADALEILRSATTIAIVGVSDKPDRPSYGVAKYLLDDTDYELYFVNPVVKVLFGKPVYATLADIPTKIDIVDVFRKSEDIPGVMEQAIAIGAKNFWMQLGITNEASAAQGEAAGLGVVQDKCIKIEYEKL
jgi:predicted CoA-binding protein